MAGSTVEDELAARVADDARDDPERDAPRSPSTGPCSTWSSRKADAERVRPRDERPAPDAAHLLAAERRPPTPRRRARPPRSRRPPPARRRSALPAGRCRGATRPRRSPARAARPRRLPAGRPPPRGRRRASTPRRARAPRPRSRAVRPVRPGSAADRVELLEPVEYAHPRSLVLVQRPQRPPRRAGRALRARTRLATTRGRPWLRRRAARRSRRRRAPSAGSRGAPRRSVPVRELCGGREGEPVPGHREPAREHEHGDEQPRRPAGEHRRHHHRRRDREADSA